MTSALREQAIALLQDFPPPARRSPAIAQEIETLLATRPDPVADLTTLKDKSWDVYLAQSTDHSTHTTHIYAPTTYILHSFNQGSYNHNSFKDDHSQHHTSHTSTNISPNWGRGLLFALLTLAAWILGNSTGYLNGWGDGYHHRPTERLEVFP